MRRRRTPTAVRVVAIFLFSATMKLQPQPVLDGPVKLLVTAGRPSPILYIWSGGLFKSIDEGLNWQASYITEAGEPQPAAEQLLMDARDENTLYLATTLAAGGVWKSSNAGGAWQKANDGLPTGDGVVDSLAAVGPNREVLYAKIGNRLFKSTNGAASWRQQGVLPGASRAFAVYAANPSLMFYAEGDRVYKSSNEGGSWSQSSTLQLFGDKLTTAMSIAVDASDPATVYVGVAGPLTFVGNMRVAGVHKSSDGGVRFQNVVGTQAVRLQADPMGRANVFSTGPGTVCKSANRGGSWRCSVVVEGNAGAIRLSIDPKAPDIIYAAVEASPDERATSRLLRSTNAGETWERVAGRVRPTLRKPVQRLAFRLPEGGSTVTELQITTLEQPHWRLPFTAAVSASWLSIAEPTAGTTPAKLRVSARAEGLQAGTYQATLLLVSEETTLATVNIPVVLTIGNFIPRVESLSFLNAASGARQNAPGSLFSAFGMDLATHTETALAAPWPTVLGSASVTIDGIAAPIYYASPTQINGQIPYEVRPGRGTAAFAVFGSAGPPVTVELGRAAPGIFLHGENRAVAANQDGTLNSPGNPAAGGSILVVYLTGIGPVDNAIASGQGALSSPLSRATLPFQATVNGQNATTLFLGLAPGFVGLAQANIVLPRLPPGDYPLEITIDGVTSNRPLVSLR